MHKQIINKTTGEEKFRYLVSKVSYTRIALLLLFLCTGLGSLEAHAQSFELGRDETINASGIPDGSNIVINHGATLVMDVSKNFGIATVQFISQNGDAEVIISGPGTASFSEIDIAVSGGRRSLTFVIGPDATVEVQSLTNTGNRPKNVRVEGVLRLSGNGHAIATSGWDNPIDFRPGSTVEYNGSGNQSIYSANYHNLILSGSGVKTFQSGTNSINGDFILSGTAGTTLNRSMTFGGKLEVSSGVLNAGNFNHTLGGDFIHNGGTFNSATSTFDFNGNFTQTISGASQSTFHRLAVNNLSGVFLSSDVRISNALNLQSGNLSVNSDASLTLENTSTVSSQGNSIIVLEPSANYRNLSNSTPLLEVRQLLQGAKGWRLLGSPVFTTYADLLGNAVTQGFAGATFPSLQPNLLWWDETDKGTSLQAWRTPEGINEFVISGRGHYFYVFDGASLPSSAGTGNYADQLPLTISATGTEVNLSSPFSFPLTFTRRDTSLVATGDELTEVNQADQGFNLLANPAASFIDFHAPNGWTKQGIDQTVYVWDPNFNNGQGKFLTFNGEVGDLGSGLIPPFQGFWIRANADNPVLSFSNAVKSGNSKSFVGRVIPTEADEALNLKFALSGEGMKANSFLHFSESGEEGPDTKDAYQLESLTEDWLLLYTYGGLRSKSPLVINHLPLPGEEQQSIPLHIAASKGGRNINGRYTLNWEVPDNWPSEVTLVLMDHLQKKAVDMLAQDSYDFVFQAPKTTGNAQARKDMGFKAPQALIFQSPYEAGEVNARTNPKAPMRPFTILVGGEFIRDQPEYRPDFAKLFTPMPNPFERELRIPFYVPVEEVVSMRILNVQGQQVHQFEEKIFRPGIHELYWEPVNLPKGVYIVQMLAEGRFLTQKIIKD
ncbi:T9SS type A sorting domain-containing protein [Cecembia lonarensis]|uniref:Secretion system C-terminal sorting domain-containing protein n=1 Tax=Cecembia lonarensis (strain CCUG 58316 / KCTC 22772 / LW9) TaxID=1225176 RepID=K1LHX6_CECL9|nr:T9SS type A sorting domain-containing protein [Cecembia lonarensis]EKB49863.1 hypothetical protein B879_01527 [Cecembia lonarensis LW9]